MTWKRRAKCIAHPDPDVFHDPAREDTATSFCRGCAVRQECLLYALERGDREGVWGGSPPRHRRRLQRLAAMLDRG